MLTILFSSDFRFLKSCGSWKRRKTDMIYQDQHIHYMQVVCNFPLKIKFWWEIILVMTVAYICYVGDSCVTFFNRSGDQPGPRSNQPQELTYFSVELAFAPLSLQMQFKNGISEYVLSTGSGLFASLWNFQADRLYKSNDTSTQMWWHQAI